MYVDYFWSDSGHIYEDSFVTEHGSRGTASNTAFSSLEHTAHLWRLPDESHAS